MAETDPHAGTSTESMLRVLSELGLYPRLMTGSLEQVLSARAAAILILEERRHCVLLLSASASTVEFADGSRKSMARGDFDAMWGGLAIVVTDAPSGRGAGFPGAVAASVGFLCLSLALLAVAWCRARRRCAGGIAPLLCLAAACLATGAAPPALSECTLPIFRSPSCGHCASVERPALDRLGTKLSVRIEPRIYDVDSIENYKLLLRVEQELGDSDNDFPIVLVGKKLLAGNEEIEKGLEPALRDWLAAGRPAGPAALSSQPSAATATVSGRPVYAAFFSQGGCAECDRVIRALSYLKSKYPSLDYRLYDTREAPSTRLLEALMEERHVPDADRIKNPSFFVGSAFLLERNVTPSRMEEAVAACMAAGTPKPWEVSEEALQAADSRIRARFSRLGLWTVIAAGLIDGINPCAFATIVFFVGYLVTTKRGAREVLVVGGCFTLAVFLTYLAVGAGALGAITKLRAYAFFSKALDVGAGGFALLLGLVSAADWWKARSGKLDEMRLVLPGFLKRRINLNISKQLRLRGIVLGAIVAGALVSLFELACTGQVYLPTLALISGDAALKARALFFLVLYNLLFVLPLMVIVALSAAGLGSQRLSGFFTRHVAASKLALTALFFVIGAVVLVNALKG